jgi:hypothetical protein
LAASINGPLVSRALKNHIRQVQPFFAEADLSTGDARHIEQIVDQPDHLFDLALHDLSQVF